MGKQEMFEIIQSLKRDNWYLQDKVKHLENQKE